jgi:hypothetical protein
MNNLVYVEVKISRYVDALMAEPYKDAFSPTDTPLVLRHFKPLFHPWHPERSPAKVDEFDP